MVEAAVASLDGDELAAARWFGATGRSVARVELEDAFVLDAAAPHLVAIARLVLDDDSRQRSTFALTGRPIRPAGDDGVWRALLVAIAEGRTIAAIDAEFAPDRGAARACQRRPRLPTGFGAGGTRPRRIGRGWRSR